MHVTAKDAAGNTIVGPGGYVDDNGNAITSVSFERKRRDPDRKQQSIPRHTWAS
ncbi:MAG TPA: hypothetical protein VN603_12050 [Candidatus Acidoferrales bacterium]|nr:hypothetical protein [Candidatus Acidoferrales bacterium]